MALEGEALDFGLDIPVNVIRSARRKKTVGARIVEGALEVRAPAAIDDDELTTHVHELGTKLLRRRSASRIDLSKRAATLARRYDLPKPTSIEWSRRQNRRWGSCTPARGTIRISERLSEYPDWVLDYVLVHELAHLVEIGHTPEFHDLVARFPHGERAEGFLTAVSLGHGGRFSGRPDTNSCIEDADD